MALIYIKEDECVRMPRPQEIFAVLARPISAKKKTDWLLAFYGRLSAYFIDENEKPYGKWVTMKYDALDRYPPRQAEFRLQPPHIAKGYFQSFDRSTEMKIVTVFDDDDDYEDECDDDYDGGESGEAQILQFPFGKKE